MESSKQTVMQQELFENTSSGRPLLPFKGEAVYFEQFFTKTESDAYLKCLVDGIGWRQEPIKMFGRQVMQPRLTAWYGDGGKSYSYSGITMQPLAWPSELLQIKQHIEVASGVTFNSALLNYYRNGQDSMGWHRDNEKELGPNPVIGSVSFGAARSFQLRLYADKTRLTTINLAHGSFLLMRGETQHYWEHRVPKTNAALGPRVNITFRVIV